MLVALSNAMSYVALDMQTPEKCFYVDYPGHDTQFTVLYQILGTSIRWTDEALYLFYKK